jgi:hypothetical protein
MIRNGLYKITTEMLDGVGISNVHIIILHDGKLHGGGPFFYTGSYTCSGGKWRGKATTRAGLATARPGVFAVPLLDLARAPGGDLMV